MILITLIIGAALFVAFILTSGAKWFVRHRFINILLIALSLIVFLGSEALTIMNEHSHYGMKNAVTTKKVSIYSVTGSNPKQPAAVPFLVLRHNVGRDPIYIFNVNKQGKPKMKHTAITDSSQFKTTGQSPYLLIEKKHRVFKNHFYRTLFAFSGQRNLKISTLNIFYLPKNHQVLTAKELQKMRKAMEKKQEMIKKAAEMEQKAAAAKSKK
ncbi:MAG: DUF4811 domain-containing protein [Sporolactobacillus sp.]